MSTRIIAEVGECFNGNMDTAKEMIHIAKMTGCDIVKFQLLDMEEVDKCDPEYRWFEKITLVPEQIRQLVAWAKDEPIEILFTPVSIKTAEYIYNEGLRTVKIASSFIGKTELLQYIKDHFQKIYVSTGMATLDEIIEVEKFLGKDAEIILLHCISEYPTGPLLQQRGLQALAEEDVHLNMMRILKALFPHREIGYSDHTNGILAPMTAAAMGAEVIEKHFTLDRSTPVEHYNKNLEYMGTDHILSVEPDQLRQMVEGIRRTEKIIGDWTFERSKGEKILSSFLRSRYKERQADEKSNNYNRS